MKTHVILLRGVTPTGKNKVLMAPLRAVLEKAGLSNVRTYIQSGNVVASTDLKRAEIEKLVHNVIKDEFGGNITVLARTADCLKKAITRCPFTGADTPRLYFTLLASKPEHGLLDEFLAVGYAPDKIKIVDDMAYVLCATKYRDLKINNGFIERKLKVSATTRVYNTVAKLVELSEQ